MPQLLVDLMVSSQPERVTDFVMEQVVLACKAVVVVVKKVVVPLTGCAIAVIDDKATIPATKNL